MTRSLLVTRNPKLSSKPRTACNYDEESERENRRDSKLVLEFHLQSGDHCDW